MLKYPRDNVIYGFKNYDKSGYVSRFHLKSKLEKNRVTRAIVILKEKGGDVRFFSYEANFTVDCGFNRRGIASFSSEVQ